MGYFVENGGCLGDREIGGSVVLLREGNQEARRTRVYTIEKSVNLTISNVP